MNNKYFKTGQFAKLCGVKKATLIHYEDLGILVPALRGENGYNYYDPAQIYDFELINVLKKMNVPLAEIKDYIYNKKGNLPACKEILEKKLEDLKTLERELQSIEMLVKNTLDDMNSLEDIQLGLIEEVTYDESELYAVYKLSSRTTDYAYTKQNVREVIQYVQDIFANESINVIEVVMNEDIINGSYKKTYGGYIAKKGIKDTNVEYFVRPAGTYLTVADRKGGDSIVDLYKKLKHYADENGYDIIGNGYEKDLLSHIVERDRENYLVRCMIQVNKLDKGD